ncbi:hypothetical protein IAD21_04119 [Abditibacteriota bacterium]|nr:hypothetical protein IAD21_04119 [Abditibacteriota bacterium]
MDMSPPSSSRSTRLGLAEVVAPPNLAPDQRRALVPCDSQPLHVARNATKARVTLVEWPPQSGFCVVLKDGSERAWWFRVSVGRYQMKREWKALCFLSGMEGVPRPCFRASADAFGLEWSQGESLLHFAPGELPESAVKQLEAVMNELHARGVTHGDLHRDNILFDAKNDRVWLIDWATSCVFGPTHRGFKAWMWREWCALDRRALAKIKARYAPDLLRDDERDLLQNGGSPLSRMVRRVGAIFKRRKRAPKETPSVPPQRASA